MKELTVTDNPKPPERKKRYYDEQEFLSTHRIEKTWINKETACRKDEISIFRDLDTGEYWGRWYDDQSLRHHFSLFDGPPEVFLPKLQMNWLTPEEAQKKRAQEIELKLIEDERYVELEKKFCETYPDELTQHRILTDILTKKNIFASPIGHDWARRWGIELWVGVESKTFFD